VHESKLFIIRSKVTKLELADGAGNGLVGMGGSVGGVNGAYRLDVSTCRREDPVGRFPGRQAALVSFLGMAEGRKESGIYDELVGIQALGKRCFILYSHLRRKEITKCLWC